MVIKPNSVLRWISWLRRTETANVLKKTLDEELEKVENAVDKSKATPAYTIQSGCEIVQVRHVAHWKPYIDVYQDGAFLYRRTTEMVYYSPDDARLVAERWARTELAIMQKQAERNVKELTKRLSYGRLKLGIHEYDK